MFEVLRSLRLWHLELFSSVKLRTLKTRREGKITNAATCYYHQPRRSQAHSGWRVGSTASFMADQMKCIFIYQKHFWYKEGFSNFLLCGLHIFVQGSGRRSPTFSRPAWHMSIDTKVAGIRCAKMKLRF